MNIIDYFQPHVYYFYVFCCVLAKTKYPTLKAERWTDIDFSNI